MNIPPPRNDRAEQGYGIFLALGLALGFGIGVALGEPSAGTVIGLGLGGLVALVLRFRPRG